MVEKKKKKKRKKEEEKSEEIGHTKPQLGFGRDQYVQEDYPTYNQCKSIKNDYTNILEIKPVFTIQ